MPIKFSGSTHACATALTLTHNHIVNSWTTLPGPRASFDATSVTCRGAAAQRDRAGSRRGSGVSAGRGRLVRARPLRAANSSRATGRQPAQLPSAAQWPIVPPAASPDPGRTARVPGDSEGSDRKTLNVKAAPSVPGFRLSNLQPAGRTRRPNQTRSEVAAMQETRTSANWDVLKLEFLIVLSKLETVT
jgi:hypothetical protein